jgi:hypothetical protein
MGSSSAIYGLRPLTSWRFTIPICQTSFELRPQGSTLHGLIHYGLRPPTSWRFTHTRPRGNQRLFPLGTPSRPATFSLFTKQELRKVAMGIDPAFNFICNRLQPYSKMLTLPMVHPVPRKLARRPVRLTLFSSTASSSELNLDIFNQDF